MKRFFLLLVIVLLISLGFSVGCQRVNPQFNQPEPLVRDAAPKIVIENEAFKVFEPTPNTKVKDKVVVKGLAKVWEATIQYEFEDGHFILDEGFTTASEGAPGWGEFEITIGLENAVNGSARVIIYEESAKDGSRLNELIIPIIVEQ